MHAVRIQAQARGDGVKTVNEAGATQGSGLFLYWSTVLGKPKINLARIQIHAYQLHRHPVGETKTTRGAPAQQLVPGGVEMIVVLAQVGYMHQAFDVDVVQRDEYAEAGDSADRSRKLLADAVLHVIALEPGLDIARCFVGAALGHGAMRAEFFPVA